MAMMDQQTNRPTDRPDFAEQLFPTERFHAALEAAWDIMLSQLAHKPRPEYHPVLACVLPDSVVTMDARHTSREDREQLFGRVGQTLARKGTMPLSVIMSGEAWAVESELPPDLQGAPAAEIMASSDRWYRGPAVDAPDRYEVLQVVGLTFDGREGHIRARTRRNKKGNITGIAEGADIERSFAPSLTQSILVPVYAGFAFECRVRDRAGGAVQA